MGRSSNAHTSRRQVMIRPFQLKKILLVVLLTDLGSRPHRAMHVIHGASRRARRMLALGSSRARMHAHSLPSKRRNGKLTTRLREAFKKPASPPLPSRQTASHSAAVCVSARETKHQPPPTLDPSLRASPPRRRRRTVSFPEVSAGPYPFIRPSSRVDRRAPRPGLVSVSAAAAVARRPRRARTIGAARTDLSGRGV
jgi:hypothetical protein